MALSAAAVLRRLISGRASVVRMPAWQKESGVGGPSSLLGRQELRAELTVFYQSFKGPRLEQPLAVVSILRATGIAHVGHLKPA
jgi:hypothetical protein